MKHYLFLILLLLISCKKNEAKKEIIPKDETLDLKYEFINQQLVRDFEFDSATSIFFKKPIQEYVYDINSPGVIEDQLKEEDSLLSKIDKEYMKRQIADSIDFTIIQNKLKVKNVYFLSKQEKKELKSKVGAENFWKFFKEKYPGKCIRSISEPVFNQEKDMLIVSLSDYCGGLDGGGRTYIFKKIKGKWERIKSLSSWVS